jgi:predicted O-methyltransferase YrrM
LKQLRGLRAGRPDLPVRALDARWSVVSSAVDLHPAPTPDLVKLLLAAAAHALDNDLAAVAARGNPEQAGWTRLWPGEHYRLLAGLVEVMQPRVVVEIGTFHGLGTLSLRDRLPAEARLITYDIVPWDETPGCLLNAADFADGRLEQRLGDLSDPAVFHADQDLLLAADLVFMDAPKDGRFEPAFLELAGPLWAGSHRVLVVDDIRLLPMLQLWRDLPYPKCDATSLGHWSGTGIATTR